MLKKVFLLAVVVFFGACQSAPEEQLDVLTEQEMIGVLIDVRIAEGQVNALALKDDSARALYKYVENKIFLQHELDSLKYIQSYEHYMRQPKKMLYITDAVIDSLKVRQKRITSPKPENK